MPSPSPLPTTDATSAGPPISHAVTPTRCRPHSLFPPRRLHHGSTVYIARTAFVLPVLVELPATALASSPCPPLSPTLSSLCSSPPSPPSVAERRQHRPPPLLSLLFLSVAMVSATGASSFPWSLSLADHPSQLPPPPFSSPSTAAAFPPVLSPFSPFSSVLRRPIIRALALVSLPTTFSELGVEPPSVVAPSTAAASSLFSSVSDHCPDHRHRLCPSFFFHLR